MHIAIVTAGGAGMFCGSCMHDNTWARSLKKQGARVTLVPTYTPLRLDEVDESTRQIFLGGINVYLDSRSALWRKVPRALTRWLDRPGVLDLVTRFGISNNAKMLGELTLAMLAGEQGPQSREVNELASFLVDTLRPDAIFFSNALLVGAVGAIRRQYSGRIFCVLQGDDIFLEDLHEPYRSQALAAIGERARSFDGFIVHSAYYRDFMADYLDLPREKFHIVPLGIDLAGHDGVPSERATATDSPSATSREFVRRRACISWSTRSGSCTSGTRTRGCARPATWGRAIASISRRFAPRPATWARRSITQGARRRTKKKSAS